MTNKKHLFLLIFIFMFGVNLVIRIQQLYKPGFLKNLVGSFIYF